MKKPRREVNRTIIDKPTASGRYYQKRMQAELRLRSLTRKLNEVHNWLPLLPITRPDLEPKEFLHRLQERHAQIVKEIQELRQNEKEIGGFRPELDRDQFEPDRADIAKMKVIMDVLDGIREGTRGLGSLAEEDTGFAVVGPVQVELGALACQAQSGLLSSWNFTEYPGFWWTDDDEATTSQDGWHFDPNYDFTRGIVYGRFSVDNPAPFDWPFVEESHDWAQLMKCAALSFEIPAPDCDSQVLYEARMWLVVNPSYNAHDYLFTAQALLFEQHDASTGAPTQLSDFERLGEGFWHDPGSEHDRIEPISIARNYSVPKGVASRVHLGLTWNMSVASGVAGTSNVSWDQLRIGPPTGEDTWGLKYNIVPL